MATSKKRTNGRFLPEGKGRVEIFLTKETLEIFEHLAKVDQRSRKQFIERLLEAFAEKHNLPENPIK